MRRRTLLAILSLTALTGPGCALREYESRIDAQRSRLEILEKEKRSIAGSSIDVPQLETGKDGTKVAAWPFDVFLRLPRDFGTAPPTASYQFNAQDPRLFRYAPSVPTYNVFIAAGLIAETGKAKDGKLPPDLFLDHVRGALMDFYRKEYKVNPLEMPRFDRTAKLKDGKPLFEKYTKKPVGLRGESLPPIDYEATAFTDAFNAAKEAAVFQVYYHQQGNMQLAIIFQFPAPGTKDYTEAIDWSLKTLALGTEAGQRRIALSRR